MKRRAQPETERLPARRRSGVRSAGCPSAAPTGPSITRLAAHGVRVRGRAAGWIENRCKQQRTASAAAGDREGSATPCMVRIPVRASPIVRDALPDLREGQRPRPSQDRPDEVGTRGGHQAGIEIRRKDEVVAVSRHAEQRDTAACPARTPTGGMGLALTAGHRDRRLRGVRRTPMAHRPPWRAANRR